jgi:peptidoglycan/xylan/chitin deacetylase (PgdA/CDA1 family)
MWYLIILIPLVIVLLYFLIRKLTTKKLCVLMYHHIGPVTDEKERKYFISKEIFSQQIDLMIEKGFQPISLSQLETAYEKKGKLPNRSVMITLDDGWEDNYIYAFPVIKEKKVPVTIFLSTAQIGVEKEILNWQQIEEMADSGLVEFASHGANHKRLRDLNDEEVLSELTESKTTIEEKFGKTVKSFCYPYGAVDRRVRKLVFKAGYTIDFGTRKGMNSWPWKSCFPLHRAHVLEGETLEDYHNELKKGRK